MSRNFLFDPRSLARVVEQVEWEPTVELYKDGTTNQEKYIQCMAILWERWMREWELPDFAALFYDVGGGNFGSAFYKFATVIPERIAQLVGFWKGLWYGANPRNYMKMSTPRVSVIPAYSAEDIVKSSIEYMVKELRTIVEKEEGSP